MNPATPHMRTGSYPQTPHTRRPLSDPDRDPKARPSLPPAPENRSSATTASRPLIPLEIIDAPNQRLYACALWVATIAWRLYDWLQMLEGNASQFYFFGKWVILDFAFFFSLPSLRIPWLELSHNGVIALFISHFVLNWLLMFDIPTPFTAPLLAFLKIFYDKELAISEHNVKISSILSNSSLIMGKQIINILPEGSAILNPDKQAYCLGGQGPTAVTVPIYFNATVPVEVELVRFDLDRSEDEVVRLGRKELKEIGKEAAKCSSEDGSLMSYKYDLTLKKPGVYRLHKVLDEYKLEVHRINEPTFVVPCPRARVRAAESSSRCLGELSDLALEVQGTPPLKIVYSRYINGKDHSYNFQSLQPEGYSSPLLGVQRSNSLVSPESEDFSWAKSQPVPVWLNESMNTPGEWQYSIDEVHDVFGNVMNYQQPDEPEPKPKSKSLYQNFFVRERPRATISGCDMRKPLKVAKGKSTKLPVKIGRPGKTPDNVPHTLTWQFSPIDTLSKSGDHGDVVEIQSFTARTAKDQPTISAPGLYTLRSVSCDSCEGEIEEPSSCLLLNPLEPQMTIHAEDIPDKCAGNSIGLKVNLDMIGTPPFKVYYDVVSKTEKRTEHVKIDGLRQQIELLPRNAGYYKYYFKGIEDSIYRVPLPQSDEYYLEQNVKPPASAYIQKDADIITACLDQPVQLDVKLSGDGPFNLEWELVHDGKRKADKATDISGDTFTIETAPLSSGGEYTLALKSIQDRTGCRIFLQEEAKISVRRQRPRAAFGVLENKRQATVVEGAPVRLPLRLSGDGPWRISYRNINGSSETLTHVARSNNDNIVTSQQGTYEIVDVRDNQCPGTIDPKAKTFEVRWHARPQLSLVPSDAVKATDKELLYIKKDICEGDVDGFEVALRGSPPYHVQYEVKHKPLSGSGSVARKEFDAALSKASISMDTAKAGLYTYTFSALSDNLYNSDKKRSTPLVLQQMVNPTPSASFVKPGQTFKLCMSDEDPEERIPIKLEGKAPFYVELEIKHHTNNYPEIFRIPNIQSNKYGIQIPRQYLKLGAQQVRIRKVRDARGCQAKLDTGGQAVHIQLYEAPAIYPLEPRVDYCVGERIAYTLSGTPPFEVSYEFGGKKMKAKSQTTNFRRVAESEGQFTITSISDKASECRAAVNVTKYIHPMPSVKISKGRVIQVDIHEGSEVEILFEFWGTPPFEFTYTRSTNARKGQKSQVLETRHDVSEDYSKVITASLEGTYEVVAIKDRYCAFSTLNAESGSSGSAGALGSSVGKKLLKQY
ncbi:hypothetical protein F4778DRAFT_796352 [Xylariomycetidae sp. FL2044]|nr:hypothetical protein F4778DRAFT_796352 [Xylariomycetidae sp. FL2044]